LGLNFNRLWTFTSFLFELLIISIMASHDIEKDITDPNDRSSSKETEKPELANIEDVERQKEQVEARLSRFTKEEEEAVIKKLDWHLMPLIFVLYSLSVLDRSNLGNAKIAGMQKDINIGGNRYAWLGTIFYISCKNLSTAVHLKRDRLMHLQIFFSNGRKWVGKSSHLIAGLHALFFSGERCPVFKLLAPVGKD
jgi:hypothetical protein